MTPDRFDSIAYDLACATADFDFNRDRIAAALRAVESETLERAIKAACHLCRAGDEPVFWDHPRSGCSLWHVRMDGSKDGCEARRIRSLKSTPPAADEAVS